MKKIVCLLVLFALLLGCAGAEDMTAEKWEVKAGWTSYALMLSQEGMDEVWEEGAKKFCEKFGGAAIMTGKMLREQTLAGYKVEDGVDELKIKGSRFTGKKEDGTVLFDYKYSWVETIEDKNILKGTRLHVFRTKDKGAGEYTFLLLTEPVKTKGDDASYVTFNLYNSANKKYKDMFKKSKVELSAIPCAMIRTDTSEKGLRFAVMRMFN